jgi:hypothetical protein
MIVNANGVELWVEQEGEGEDVLFISGLADEGRLLGRPGRAAQRPLSGHDLRQPGRRPLGDPGGRVRDRRLRRRYGRAPRRARRSSAHTSSARRWAARSRRSSRSPARLVRSLVLQRHLVPGRPVPARGLPQLDVVGEKAGLDPGLPRDRQPAGASRRGSGTTARWTSGSQRRGSPHAQSVDAFSPSTEALIATTRADRVGGIGRRRSSRSASSTSSCRRATRRSSPSGSRTRALVVIPDVGHQPFQEGRPTTTSFATSGILSLRT